jgi:hypothetical protein
MYGETYIQFHAILTTTIKGSEMVAAHSGHFTIKERNSIPTRYETGRVPELDWTLSWTKILPC